MSVLGSTSRSRQASSANSRCTPSIRVGRSARWRQLPHCAKRMRCNRHHRLPPRNHALPISTSTGQNSPRDRHIAHAGSMAPIQRSPIGLPSRNVKRRPTPSKATNARERLDAVTPSIGQLCRTIRRAPVASAIRYDCRSRDTTRAGCISNSANLVLRSSQKMALVTPSSAGT